MKKKLIFVAEALWIGGIETALVNLLNRLDYDRYEVSCLIIRDDQTLASRITPNCRLLVADRKRTVSFPNPYRHLRLTHLVEPSANPSRLHRLFQWIVPGLKWLENRLYIQYIRQNLASEHFDTAIIYSDRTAELTVRGIRADQYLMFYHHGAMRHAYHDEIGYRKCRQIIAVSENIASLLREARKQYRDKIIMINNLVDTADVLEKSRQPLLPALPENAFNLVSCGRISPEKGYDLAGDACAILLQQGMSDLQWWIVGGGPSEPELREQIKRLGIEDHFHLLGMQKNPYPYLRMADLYVQPSRFEGHSVTVLEARVLAKPIVATRAAAAEQLRDGRDGLLCACSAEQLADAVTRLHDSPGLRAQFTQALSALDFERLNQSNLHKLESLL